MGAPQKFQLVEMGPGKGTLMADVLRATKAFPRFREALSSVHLVETSPGLRERQRKALGCLPLHASSTSSPKVKGKNKKKKKQQVLVGGAEAAAAEEEEEAMHMKLPDGSGEVFWHYMFQDVPEEAEVPMIFIGQEILDALPVHQFEFTTAGWRERLVDLNINPEDQPPSSSLVDPTSSDSSSSDSSSPSSSTSSTAPPPPFTSPSSNLSLDLPFRFVLSQKETPAVTAYLKERVPQAAAQAFSFEPSVWRAEEKEALRPSSSTSSSASSSSTTPASTTASTASTTSVTTPPPSASSASAFNNESISSDDHGASREWQMSTTDTALSSSPSPSSSPSSSWAFPGAMPGDEVEVCPAAMALVQDLSTRIARTRGAALLVDYGGNHAFPDSLRAFHKHEQAHPLFRPGEVDLTFDVDFAALKGVVQRTEGVAVHGAVDQGWFLEAMGAPQRLEALLEKDEVDDDMAEALVGAYERLVDPAQMGERYKVMALVDTKQPGAPPGGFEEAASQSELSGLMK